MKKHSTVRDLKEGPEPDRRVRFNDLLGGVRAQRAPLNSVTLILAQRVLDLFNDIDTTPELRESVLEVALSITRNEKYQSTVALTESFFPD